MTTDLAPRVDSATECWADADVVELVCCQVQDVTHDVKSFVFVPPPGRHFEHEPGQFLTLRLQVDGVEVTRCYTISSPPTRPHRLAITVKRVPDGPVSSWLHDHLTPGTRVSVLPPVGSFTLPLDTTADRQRLLFLSAGSGITPLMSMTRTLFDLGSDADVVFVHSARTPADIIFRRELDAMESAMPNLRVVHVCEQDYPADRWPGLRGRLTASMLQTLVPDLDQRTAYTCGPTAYMSAVRPILESLDHDPRRYHEESFDLEAAPARAAPDPVDLGVRTFDVEFARSGRVVPCREDQLVLDAALEAGLRPASACGQGMCGTCKLTLLSGEVDMRHDGGIRPKEIAAGKVLICCSTPRSDLRLEA